MSPPSAAEWARLEQEVGELEDSVRVLRESEIRADERRAQVAAALEDLKHRAQRLETEVGDLGRKLDSLIARLDNGPRGWTARDIGAILGGLVGLVTAIATAIGAYTGHLPGQGSASAATPPPIEAPAPVSP